MQTPYPHRVASEPAHDGHGFLRHLLEMGLAMIIGMMVGATIFLSAVGMTAAEAMREHAVLFVVLQAVGMTTTMVAVMLYRRSDYGATASA